MPTSPIQPQETALESAAGDRDSIAWRQVTWSQLGIITVGVMLIFFTLTLDHYILAAVTLSIINRFQSEQDFAWYSAGYFLTNMSMLPVYGQLYNEFSVRKVYSCAIVVFIVGTAICAISWSSMVLIAGRLVCGLGGGGLYLGSILIAGLAVEGKARSFYIALISSMDGVSSIVGPLLGGYFSAKDKWRACFYTTIGLSATALVLVVLFFKDPPQPKPEVRLRFLQRIAKVDFAGFVLLVCGFICLLLAMNWAVVVYPWRHSKVWGGFLGAGLMLCLYIVLQFMLGEKAAIPCRILTKRTVFASAAFMMSIAMLISVLTYFLPSYFQAVQGLDEDLVGTRVLPFMATLLFTPLLSGALISWTGYYVPFTYVGTTLTSVGAVLMASLNQSSSASRITGYLFLTGFGIGLCNQIPYTSIQCAVAKEDIVTGSALCTFLNSMGSMLGITVSHVVFTVFSMGKLSGVNGIDAREVLRRGPYEGVMMLAGETRYRAQEAFAAATEDALFVPVALSALCVFCCFLMGWNRLPH